MSERFEVEPVAHSEVREGDTLLKDMNPPTAKKVASVKPGSHGGSTRFDFEDGDWLVTGGWVLRVAPVAASRGTEDEPRGDEFYEKGRAAKAAGLRLDENPAVGEAAYVRWATGWLDEHHGRPRVVRRGSGDELRAALAPLIVSARPSRTEEEPT